MTERDYTEIFKKNFLTSVSCEVRFKPLLLIQNFIPKFQKEIRDALPNINMGMPIIIPEMASPLSSLFRWDFSSIDGKKVIKISIDTISFIQSNYNNFNEYLPEVLKYFKKFFDLCGIKEFSRIGLRYVNEFPLKELENSEEISLLKFFNPMITTDVLSDLNPIQFDLMMRRNIENVTLVTRNNLIPNIDKKDKFIIDIDSFKMAEIKQNDLEGLIKILHDLLIKEFYRNITNDLIKILRKRS